MPDPDPRGPAGEAIDFIEDLVGSRKALAKAELVEAVVAKFGLQRDGKAAAVWFRDGWAITFAESNKSSDPSNTICALKHIRNHDDKPIIICLLHARAVRFVLANATLLRRAGHSSSRLSRSKLVGSVNWPDISKELRGISNEPENFGRLFKMHSEVAWDDNFARLLQLSTQVVSQPTKVIAAEARRAIMNSAQLALRTTNYKPYVQLAADLSARVAAKHDGILGIAALRSGKQRGDRIEELLTGRKPSHALADEVCELANGTRVLLDIKSKLLNNKSAPKAVNVDKLLDAVSGEGNNVVFSYWFVLVDVAKQAVNSVLVSALDSRLVDSRVQDHWSGRGSRGTVQLSGRLDFLSDPDFREHVHVAKARAFLKRLIDGQ